jgi:hypothetical protein
MLISELSPKAKEIALDKVRHIWGWDSSDTQSLTEAFVERLETLGFEVNMQNINWSVDYGQRNYVTYTAALPYLETLTPEKLKENGFEGLIESATAFANAYTVLETTDLLLGAEMQWDDFRVCGGTVMVAIGNIDWYPFAETMEGLVLSLEAAAVEFVKDVERYLVKMGRAEIEYKDSEEYVLEQLESNEVEFCACGVPESDPEYGQYPCDCEEERAA